MMRYNFLRSLNNSMETQNSLQEQLSDGKSLHRPSDDPVRTVRDLSFKTSLTQNTQFTQNLQDAQSWMENTDGVMSDLSSVMIKIKELVVSADDTKPTDALNTIGAQIDGLINQIVSLGNTKVGDRYLFGGQNDSTQPFVRTTIKDPNSELTREVVIYNGDDSRISMPIQTGAVNPSQDSVNLVGTEVFGPASTIYGQKTLDVLNHLLEIKNELKKTSSVSQTASAVGIGTVTGSYSGAGFQSFDVKIEEVDNGLGTGVGQVTKAKYSTDGGNTWKDVAPADLVYDPLDPAKPTSVKLENGITFNIATSSGNGVGGVYSFRVPQKSFAVAQSNTQGGAAALAGTAADVASIPNSIRIDAVDSNGKVIDASYSSDGGATWTVLSNYTITGSAGSKATVTGAYDPAYAGAGAPVVKIDGVDATGKITAASVGGVSLPVSYDVINNSDTGTTSTVANVTLTNGVILHIPTNSANKVNDTYTVEAKGNYIDTSGPNTVINLPNGSAPSGLSMTITTNAANTSGDTYSFNLPQGTGPDTTWLSGIATKYVDDDHNMQLRAQTNLGARMSMYEMAYNMFQDQNLVIQTDIAHAEDIDMPKAITDFNTAQNIYRSALAVGGRIMPTSLVDFLT